MYTETWIYRTGDRVNPVDKTSLAQLSRRHAIIGLLVLLGSYFVVRLIFQQLTELKTLFIYSTGYVVHLFHGVGSYINSEWLFVLNQTQFVLNASCSGTTFFSLLVSYLLYRKYSVGLSNTWLWLAFPITIAANTMRVLSAMHIHNLSAQFGWQQFDADLHVATGTVAFLISFLLVTYCIERQRSHA